MTSTYEHVVHVQEAIRGALVKMFIKMEIPFRKVERESFYEVMILVSQKFQIISCFTLLRDILKLWDAESFSCSNLSKSLSHYG
jgi:hypothetical protein